MIGIQHELAQLQVEFVQLIDHWNGLSEAAQRKVWANYAQGPGRRHERPSLLRPAPP